MELNRESYIASLRIDASLIHTAPFWVRNDKEIMIAAVTQNGWALQYASIELRNDRDVVLVAVSQNGWALQYELRDNVKVVISAVTQNGCALYYASNQLCNNKNIVCNAVSQSWSALQYVSKQLRDDKDIVLIVVKQSWYALQYVSEQMRDDKDIALATLRSPTYWNALQITHFKSEFLIRAIIMGGRPLRCWLDALKNDPRWISITKQYYINLDFPPQSLNILYDIELIGEIASAYLLRNPEFILHILAIPDLPHHPKIDKCKALIKLSLPSAITMLLFGLI